MARLEIMYHDYLHTTWKDNALARVIIAWQQTDFDMRLLGCASADAIPMDLDVPRRFAVSTTATKPEFFLTGEAATREVKSRIDAILPQTQAKFIRKIVAEDLKIGFERIFAARSGHVWGSGDIAVNESASLA